MIMSKKEELNGKFYMNTSKSNLISMENPILKEAEKLREGKKAQELCDILIEADKNKQKELEEKLETLELIPNGNKILILPYPTNPYRKIITKTGILTSWDGEFKNPDSGEMDKLDTFVGCAKVIEIGPDCRLGKVGDDLFYDTRSVYPIPFMSLGYQLTSEPQVLVWINDGLKERFKM